MKQWTADFTNDPYNDYSLIIEVLYDDEEVAVIKQEQNELTLQVYPNDKELIIPIDWLSALFIEAKKRMIQ